MRVGVDEAGKGPVLGPMVAAAVGVPEPGVLPDGVADSKQLAAERREDLAAMIREHDRIAVGVAAIEVERIDDPATDMNSLTVAGQAEAVEELRNGGADARDLELLADAGDTSEERFARRLSDAIEAGTASSEFAVEARHGADDEDPVVAAASIVAKVERDRRVAEIAAEYGEVGSGYPSDPTTRDFLECFVDEHGELPACARSSWQTCDDLLAQAEQTGLDAF